MLRTATRHLIVNPVRGARLSLNIVRDVADAAGIKGVSDLASKARDGLGVALDASHAAARLGRAGLDDDGAVVACAAARVGAGARRRLVRRPGRRGGRGRRRLPRAARSGGAQLQRGVEDEDGCGDEEVGRWFPAQLLCGLRSETVVITMLIYP